MGPRKRYNKKFADILEFCKSAFLDLPILLCGGLQVSVQEHVTEQSFDAWVFLSHQIGAALGSWIGGVSYDLTGSYTLAFTSAALLAFLASALVLAIQEEPRTRTPAVTPVSTVTY